MAQVESQCVSSSPFKQSFTPLHLSLCGMQRPSGQKNSSFSQDSKQKEIGLNNNNL